MADTTVVFCGIKFEVGDEDLHELERKAHPMQVAARKLGIDCYLGKLAPSSDKYFLFIGKLLGKLGVEDQMGIQISPHEFARIVANVSEKLNEAEIIGTVSLHAEFEADY